MDFEIKLCLNKLSCANVINHTRCGNPTNKLLAFGGFSRPMCDKCLGNKFGYSIYAKDIHYRNWGVWFDTICYPIDFNGTYEEAIAKMEQLNSARINYE
jgi:hypothetical protein